ncbi:MAG: hypothetical protein ACREJT_03605 [Myxococcota bacterium]
MTARRCLAALVFLGCGTRHPHGGLQAREEIAIAVSSSVSPELISRRIARGADGDITGDFTGGCSQAVVEATVKSGGLIVLFPAVLPAGIVACAFAGFGVEARQL